MDFMRSEAGFRAPITAYKEGRRVYYRYSDRTYSLAMQPINPIEADLLKNTLDMLGRIKGLPQFEFLQEISLKLKKSFQLEDLADCIYFDQNEYLKNLHLLGDLLKVIKRRCVLRVSYQSFHQERPEVFIIHPYFLKQYNKRWFLFGQCDGFDTWTNLPLDRIVSVEVAEDIPFMQARKTHQEYFEDIIGVTKPIDEDCQIVKIKVDKELWPYIESKPLHPSQKIVQRADEYTVIQLEVIPNYEFYAQVLGYGSSVEVLDPASVREEIRKKLKGSLEKYDSIL